MNIFNLSLEEFEKEVDKVLEGISSEELLNELEKCGLKTKGGSEMREIKFRGKSDDEWVYGHLLRTEENDYGEHGNEHFNYLIQTDEMGQYNEYNQYYITDDDTIGQYTGLKDKNGVEIYEGDIVKINNDYEKYGINAGEIYQVYFKSGGYRLLPKYCKEALGYWLESGEDFVVIGNIYDNPELLKESN